MVCGGSERIDAAATLDRLKTAFGSAGEQQLRGSSKLQSTTIIRTNTNHCCGRPKSACSASVPVTALAINVDGTPSVTLNATNAGWAAISSIVLYTFMLWTPHSCIPFTLQETADRAKLLVTAWSRRSRDRTNSQVGVALQHTCSHIISNRSRKGCSLKSQRPPFSCKISKCGSQGNLNIYCFQTKPRLNPNFVPWAPVSSTLGPSHLYTIMHSSTVWVQRGGAPIGD